MAYGREEIAVETRGAFLYAQMLCQVHNLTHSCVLLQRVKREDRIDSNRQKNLLPRPANSCHGSPVVEMWQTMMGG